MVSVREKCFSLECNGKPDIFPLYLRGYDNKFKRVSKEKEHERTGDKRIMDGYMCPICKAIIWRDRK